MSRLAYRRAVEEIREMIAILEDIDLDHPDTIKFSEMISVKCAADRVSDAALLAYMAIR